MFQRIFSQRANASYYIIVSILVTLFIVYEIKIWYAKHQKAVRFAYYNSYVNEVNELADKIELSYNKSSSQTQQLGKLLLISLKKDGNSSYS